MAKYIGLSLSLCIKDIVEGRVNIVDVERIIAGTSAVTISDWRHVLNVYSDSYWVKYPGKATLIALRLLLAGKVEQPRLYDYHWQQDISDGIWLRDGKLVPTDEFYLNQ